MWAELAGIAVVVILVGGLAGLAYLFVRTPQPMPPPPRAGGRDTRDVERDIPPPSM
jgi:uncharacterized membrane protein